MKTNATDNAVFVFQNNSELLILLSETDDFLIMSSSKELYLKLKAKLNTSFEITFQESNVLHYLNLQIIQSEYGISFDQTKHILDMVEPHFPRGSTFTKVNSPFRTDREYESELATATPASQSELQLLEKEYGGSYLSLYGQLLHVSTISRPQITNAMLRLGKFQSGPCKLAFEGLRRIFRCLASNPNIPIMYPRKTNPKTSKLVFYQPSSPPEPEISINLPPTLSSMVDSNYATDLQDRKSVSSDIVLYNGVAVSWKASKQLCIATSTTDAETRSLFSGLRRVITFRHFLQHLGIPEMKPTVIFEDNKGTQDIVHAGRLTPRVKHIDVPLCYIHEQHRLQSFDVTTCSTHLMLCDGLNKALTGPSIRNHSAIYTGKRFYPPVSSEHYKQLIKLVPLSC